MTDLLSKHPELIGALVVLIGAIAGWIKEHTKRLNSEKAMLTVSDAIEVHNSPELKEMISQRRRQLEAGGEPGASKAIGRAAATVDDGKASPDVGLQQKYENLPIS